MQMRWRRGLATHIPMLYACGRLRPLIFNQNSGRSTYQVNMPIQQSYLWYGSSIGDKDPQASDTYIFRPDGAPQTAASRLVPLKIVRGPLVDEVHQQFNLWIYQLSLIRWSC